MLILAHFHSFSKILVHRSCEILSEVVYNRSPRDLSSISRTSRRFPILRPTYFSTITDTPSLELTHFSRTIQSHPRPTCLNSSHLLASHFLNTSHLCSPLLSSSTVFSATLPFHTHYPNMTSQASSPAASAGAKMPFGSHVLRRAPRLQWTSGRRLGDPWEPCEATGGSQHKRLRPMETDGDRGTTVA